MTATEIKLKQSASKPRFSSPQASPAKKLNSSTLKKSRSEEFTNSKQNNYERKISNVWDVLDADPDYAKKYIDKLYQKPKQIVKSKPIQDAKSKQVIESKAKPDLKPKAVPINSKNFSNPKNQKALKQVVQRKEKLYQLLENLQLETQMVATNSKSNMTAYPSKPKITSKSKKSSKKSTTNPITLLPRVISAPESKIPIANTIKTEIFKSQKHTDYAPNQFSQLQSPKLTDNSKTPELERYSTTRNIPIKSHSQIETVADLISFKDSDNKIDNIELPTRNYNALFSHAHQIDPKSSPIQEIKPLLSTTAIEKEKITKLTNESLIKKEDEIANSSQFVRVDEHQTLKTESPKTNKAWSTNALVELFSRNLEKAPKLSRTFLSCVPASEEDGGLSFGTQGNILNYGTRYCSVFNQD
ncbi:hypothetical protein BC833DRAFT_580235 [Globomyces pollinis-pini]|nr:hypothetical protein BC833DRAFT_580235 [Globomyces pollinis-pini]